MTTWDELTGGVLAEAMSAFGREVLYAAGGGAPTPVVAIFDAEHEEIDLQAGVPVQTVQPVLGVRLSDLPARPRQGDQVTIDGHVYRVVNVQEDGQGGASLRLHR